MLKRLVKAAAASPLGWRIGARLRPDRGVCVLMYHRILRPGDPFPGTPLAEFVAQMRWLAARCTLIAPEDLEAEAEAPRDRSRPSVLLTFDDGYRDYHDLAYPVLQELRIPAVNFLATSFLGTDRLIWTDAVTWAVVHSPRRQITLPWDRSVTYALGALEERKATAKASREFLKAIPDAERERWQAALCAELGVDPGDGSAGRQMLTWDEVRATMELTRYGGHTHTHPILSQVDAARAEQEIRTCHDLIARETGVTPRLFAYPNGRARDFTAGTQEILRRLGYRLAFSTEEGLHRPGADLLAVRRQPSTAHRIGDFAWLVAGR